VLRRAVAPFAVVGVLYLPWVPTLLDQITNTGAPWSHTPGIRGAIREVAALVRDERILVALGLAMGSGLLPLWRRPRSRPAVVALTLLGFVVVPIAIGWLAAHVEPSWATRYLAVVVGPLLLLIGLGLARAGGVGIGALAIAALLVVQPFTRLAGEFERPSDAKSNGAAIVEALGPLSAGDVVATSQPEAVPLLRYYLGEGPRYVEPAGEVDDPDVVDWRGAEERLLGSSLVATLEPIVEALRPGQRLLLVIPDTQPEQTDTAYVDAFRDQGRDAFETLSDDDRLEVVGRSDFDRRDDLEPEPSYPLTGLLLERVAG
jgi:hypothetical protein